MKLFLVSAILVLGLQATGPGCARAPSSTQTTASGATRITLTVPDAAAELVAEGKTIPGTGSSREFVTPPLETSITYHDTLSATWQPNAYTTMTRSRAVSFRAGERLVVDLTVDDPNEPCPRCVCPYTVRCRGGARQDGADQQPRRRRVRASPLDGDGRTQAKDEWRRRGRIKLNDIIHVEASEQRPTFVLRPLSHGRTKSCSSARDFRRKEG
jgi:uncharacterized protein (TIGR03000 family)